MSNVVNSIEYSNKNLVSLETAIVLEPIYKKYCNNSYIQEERIKEEYVEEYGEWYTYELRDEFPDKYEELVEDVWVLSDITNNNDESDPRIYSAPNIFDVVTYIIENYKIYISAAFAQGKWYWYSQNLDSIENSLYANGIPYDTIQEAIDMGIRITIKDMK
jgi:hypothetical protein